MNPSKKPPQEQTKKSAPRPITVIRPSGAVSGFVTASLSLVMKVPAFVFGSFPLYTMGLISRRHFFLVGFAILMIKTTLLTFALAHFCVSSPVQKTTPHPWAYTEDELKHWDLLFNDWMGNLAGVSGSGFNVVLFLSQLAVSLILAVLTACAYSGRMSRLTIRRISQLARFFISVGLIISLFHVLHILLPMPYILALSRQKVAELQSKDLNITTASNLMTYYRNKRQLASGVSLDALEFPLANLLDKVHFNEQCCGLFTTDDWLEFAPEELAVFADFLDERPGQQPPSFRTTPPASCYDVRQGKPHKTPCANKFANRYWGSRPEMLHLCVTALLSVLSAIYLQRAFTAQDGLSGLEPEAIKRAGDIAATCSLMSGGRVTGRQMNTTVPLVSVPTRMVRPVFEQCPKIGECTADAAHAQLGYNEPLSFEERTTVTCSPQFFPLCFTPDAGALVSLLQFCIRIIWGFIIYKVFVTNFARFYDKSSLGSAAYSRLISVTTLVAFVFPVVVSKRYLLVTILFIPSLFLDFGAGYVTSKIVEAVFSGPFQTLMYNVNQTQLSMQCFMLSGTDLAEAGLKLSLKPFVNIAHEFMTSTLLLGFLFKKLNSTTVSLHYEYSSDNDDMQKRLQVTNREMKEKVYDDFGANPPDNPDEMPPELLTTSQIADEELRKSEEEEMEEEAQAIKDMNSRIATAESTVKLAKDEYNKFTSYMSNVKRNASTNFKRRIKRMCKHLLFDSINKCNKFGDALCRKLMENVPWYLRIANFFMKFFDCPDIQARWKKENCERDKPASFVKRHCLGFARKASPEAGFDGEFLNVFSMMDGLISFVTIDIHFTTVIGRFLPDFSADHIFTAMAVAAFLLIEVSGIGTIKQTWELINNMMIGSIIGEIFIFIKRFNTDLTFCNHYVTHQFIEIDYRRKQTIVDKVSNRARDSLLPFAGWEMREPVWVGEEHENELIVYPERLGLTLGERKIIKRMYIADIGMLAIISSIFLCNYIVKQAVDTMNAGLPNNLTFESQSQLNVTVHGVDVNFAKRLTFGLVRDLSHTAVVNTTAELGDCKVVTEELESKEVKTVVTLIVLKLCMNILYGYMRRLRPFLCALFYPEQQRRRTVALYNQLLRRRAKRQRQFRDQVLQRILAEKFNRDPFGIVTQLRLRSPTWNSIFGSLPFMNGNVECLCCGDSGFEQFKICLDCCGSYCRPCWYRLNSMCLLCILLFKRLALDYQEFREELRRALLMLGEVSEEDFKTAVSAAATPAKVHN